ncbi:DUF3168 domain-containing protein [Inquilinus sp. CA228]|uniref:DUF3168 domain-containing protein n=1 Tax=Inquilinus sp. CA228 TaxID=3455609 RepID=UPI003F8D621C
MSADSRIEVQIAILAALGADAELAAIVGDRIYDHAPDDCQAPYIQIGGGERVPFHAQCMNGSDLLLTITTWADGHHASEDVIRMDRRINDLLDGQRIPVDGHGIQTMRLVRNRGPFRDPDGKTRQGVNEYRCITLPAG